MAVFKATFPVRYYETDQMAVVHHSNYIRYFEIARDEMMVQLGFPIEKCESELGVLVPIVSVECHFRHPARMGDIITATAEVNKVPMAKMLIKGSSFPCIPVIEKMAGVNVEMVGEFGDAQGVGFMVRTQEIFVKMDGLVNVAEEIEKAQKELEYQQKFLQGVRAKLANQNFVAHAPAAVIENERKKEADSLSKIESLEAKLKSLKK